MSYIPPVSRIFTHSISPSRYLGEVVCKKHPELKGERYIANRLCVGCKRDKNAEKRQTPEALAKRADQARLRREMETYKREMHVKLMEMIRQKCVDIALEKKTGFAWRQHWMEAIDRLREEGIVPK